MEQFVIISTVYIILIMLRCRHIEYELQYLMVYSARIQSYLETGQLRICTSKHVHCWLSSRHFFSLCLKKYSKALKFSMDKVFLPFH
jgi:hypothetical protein